MTRRMPHDAQLNAYSQKVMMVVFRFWVCVFWFFVRECGVVVAGVWRFVG